MPTIRSHRVILIVLDSVGVGELPDADVYGDRGQQHARQHRAARSACSVPTLRSLGLGRVVDDRPRPRRRRRSARYGRMAEASPGKDSVTGHWELMGLVLDRPFPDVPDGFPAELIARVRAPHRPRRRSATRPRPAPRSSTSSAPSTCATGKPIVYTSADSVFQIAAHEDVIPVAELYRICEIAFELVGTGLGVGRVIARPFVGAPGAFKRTANRRDFALTPFAPTLLDRLKDAGHPGRGRSARSRTCSPAAA